MWALNGIMRGGGMKRMIGSSLGRRSNSRKASMLGRMSAHLQESTSAQGYDAPRGRPVPGCQAPRQLAPPMEEGSMPGDGLPVRSHFEGRGEGMKYRVHRLEVTARTAQEKLEAFLSHLEGEVVAVVPYVRPTFQLMGATSRVAFLLIVERVR